MIEKICKLILYRSAWEINHCINSTMPFLRYIGDIGLIEKKFDVNVEEIYPEVKEHIEENMLVCGLKLNKLIPLQRKSPHTTSRNTLVDALVEHSNVSYNRYTKNVVTLSTTYRSIVVVRDINEIVNHILQPQCFVLYIPL